MAEDATVQLSGADESVCNTDANNVRVRGRINNSTFLTCCSGPVIDEGHYSKGQDESNDNGN